METDSKDGRGVTIDDVVPEVQALRAELEELKALLKVHTHDQHGAAVIRL